MKKYFNIAGPCNPIDHYMVPVDDKIKEVMPLIEYKQYFVIHAARQTGKTTLLKELVKKINSESFYYALYCSLESVHVFVEPERGIPEILNNIKFSIKYSKLPKKELFGDNVNTNDISILIKTALVDYCSILDRPLIIFFDEIDSLADGTLVTFLRQLRDGYITRPEIPFLHSAALVGMRNIRDYKSRLRDDRSTLGSASPFNVISEGLNLQSFTYPMVEYLYNQHTKETGQIFVDESIQKVFDETNGQPWLVNAIAREVIVKLLDMDNSKPITSDLIEQAIQNIILRRDTHFDSLLDKLKESRVRKIIEPIIIGKKDTLNILDDDTKYCLDLGLIKDFNGELKPANKIYAEVIIRTLSYDTQYNLQTRIQNVWIDEEGNLDMNGLLKGFQEFWRENSEIWEEKYEYKEAVPHLILQAFLQRVINAKGSVLHEYAINRERIDLCVLLNGKKYPIELKLFYSKSVVEQGLKQLSSYMDKLGEKVAWLVIFDRNVAKSWDEKIYWKTEERDDRLIYVVGC